ncbi:MAG TPA: helix-turn-helix domain-containing protein [Vitreimonas sp.]|nr:helix-turn-helix domain-containing protein [Vitreimonas sp.]
MNTARLGAAVRAVRLRKRLRQRDVAARAGVSQPLVSRLERGRLDTLSLRTIEAICGALDIRVDLVPRWRGADLDRMLNAEHASLHESLARWFRRVYPEWTLAPEVSFAIYGERGVIDVLAWHAPSRTLLVIELKTQVVDLNELVGTVDRKRRLAARAARDRGWVPERVGVWVVVAAGRTNRRHISDHATYLRNAFPADARAVRRWLAQPSGALAALSVESFGVQVTESRGPRRIRRPAA